MKIHWRYWPITNTWISISNGSGIR